MFLPLLLFLPLLVVVVVVLLSLHQNSCSALNLACFCRIPTHLRLQSTQLSSYTYCTAVIIKERAASLANSD